MAWMTVQGACECEAGALLVRGGLLGDGVEATAHTIVKAHVTAREAIDGFTDKV